MPPCGHDVVETGDPFVVRAEPCVLLKYVSAADNYYLSIEALTADNIFFTARRGDDCRRWGLADLAPTAS
jgi:hypothetical protein